jgi:hypothetical protein
MKQLHFQKVSGRGSICVADEGPYRFALHEAIVGSKPGRPIEVRWRAKVFERYSVRISPIADAEFRSRAKAIDWLARYRVPEKEEAECR